MTNVIDNKDRHRFELDVDGSVAFANYKRDEGQVLITHVEAPLELRGTGAAGKLMAGIVQLIRADGEKIVPICPYAVSWLRKHHEENKDILL